MEYSTITRIIEEHGLTVHDSVMLSYNETYEAFSHEAGIEREFKFSHGQHTYSVRSTLIGSGFHNWFIIKIGHSSNQARGSYVNEREFARNLKLMIALDNYQFPPDMQGVSMYLHNRFSKPHQVVEAMREVEDSMIAVYGKDSPFFMGSLIPHRVLTWGETQSMSGGELEHHLVWPYNKQYSSELNQLRGFVEFLDAYGPKKNIDVWVFSDVKMGSYIPENGRKWTRGSKVVNIRSHDDHLSRMSGLSFPSYSTFQAIVDLNART